MSMSPGFNDKTFLYNRRFNVYCSDYVVDTSTKLLMLYVNHRHTKYITTDTALDMLYFFEVDSLKFIVTNRSNINEVSSTTLDEIRGYTKAPRHWRSRLNEASIHAIVAEHTGRHW